MICYYHNDLDGRCAAAIVLRKHPACHMREINYSDNPDFAEECAGENGVIIVDFSFTPEKMLELIDIVDDNIIWIDHHKTAKDYVYHYGMLEWEPAGLRDFTEPGLSGCELTWCYLFPNNIMPEAVRLLGDYDTWRFDTKEASLEFQFGMRASNNTPDSIIWHHLLKDDVSLIETLKLTGCSIIKYKNNVAKSFLKHRYELFWEGCNCLVVNTPMIDSTMFDDYKNQFDICLCWWKTAPEYIISMRSNGAVDVSAIAKKHGGGGHSGAAGFVCDKLPF